VETEIVTPEIDVLVAVAVWLRQRKVLPYQFSIAHGRDIDVEAAKSKLNTALDKERIPAELRFFVGDGPDITAISRSEYWQIECKAAGTGKRTTQRNNFDRALASAVSYYTESPPDFAKEGLAAFTVFNSARPVLGMALPETHDYMSELKRRVKNPLRNALNLWVLLYNPADGTVRGIAPDGDY
jgi:hypothetical protein